MDDDHAEKRTRGQGKGSKFFAVGHDVWERLWAVETANRINLVLAYFVLLAGTGSDHRLTKWSAKACEQYLGMGKPRAKRAIEELSAAGLVTLTDTATRMAPQYQLPELPRDADPIFLPVQLVTGFSGETPVLRRIKETGDPMLLRMLIDLYGLVALDATFGVPISNLREGGPSDGQTATRKIASIGANAVWAITSGPMRSGGGEWASRHYVPAKNRSKGDWALFWERLDLLKQMGALYFEPWLFDSELLDAEPLMPLDPAGFYRLDDPDAEAKLTTLALDASRALIGEERGYLLDGSDAQYFVPLPLHHQQPTLRHVARLRVEADTPGRRLAWRRRQVIIESLSEAYQQLIADVATGAFERPLRIGATGGGL